MAAVRTFAHGIGILDFPFRGLLFRKEHRTSSGNGNN
jgi:hypothetical protein